MRAETKTRVALLRILQALPNPGTTRAKLLPVLLRRAPDSMLPGLERLVMAEHAAQARLARILA